MPLAGAHWARRAAFTTSIRPVSHLFRLSHTWSRPSAPLLVVVAALSGAACESSAAKGTTDSTAPASTAAVAPDTLWRPVLLTLRRDSIAWPGGAPMDTVRARIDRAIERLRSNAEFDVLAVSPALLVVRVRAKVAGGAPALAESLKTHPLIEATRIEDAGQPR